MALIKHGALVAQISGSIAGTTFARNRYGAYARNRTKPVNPNTGRQQTVRAALAFLTDRWSTAVTAAQRAAWNLYGANVVMLNKLGENINLTGFNHYIRSNMIRKQAGWPMIDAGPVLFEIPEADPTLATAGSEATQIITITYDATMDWADEDGGYIAFFQGSPQNAQRNFFAGPWRYFGAIQGVNGAPPASPYAAACNFAIAETQRDWVYARIIRADGRLSSPFRADCFIAA